MCVCVCVSVCVIVCVCMYVCVRGRVWLTSKISARPLFSSIYSDIFISNPKVALVAICVCVCVCVIVCLCL